MKKAAAAMLVTAFALLAGIVALATPAGAVDPCIATCTNGMLYVCCPHIECVPIHENCKGTKCKCVDTRVWSCWYEFDPSCVLPYD